MPTAVVSTPLIGFECNVYYGTSGGDNTTAPSTLMQYIFDPKYGLQYGEVAVNLRKHAGQKTYMKGNKDLVVTFNIADVYNADGTRPTEITTIVNAGMSRNTPVKLFFANKVSGEGPCCDFELWLGEKATDDEGIQYWPVTAKPWAGGEAIAWITPASSTPASGGDSPVPGGD